MELNELVRTIPGSNGWQLVREVNKGWSSDRKYYVETGEGQRLLLRVSDIAQYDEKKREFEAMKQLDTLDINIPRPIDFGLCEGGAAVYLLLTWVNGAEAEKVLPTLNSAEQYRLGLEAGRVLAKMHQVPAPEGQTPWSERFNAKIDRNIRKHLACRIQAEGADRIIAYIETSRHLLDDRPQCFQHGDYHCGNMLINNQRHIGIIDFNRLDYGDPWEEFNRITWCAAVSPLFASGRINGYFEDAVPDEFFRLLALYIGSNQLASVPWAIPFGPAEVQTMLQQTKAVLAWYDDFRSYIPSWYISQFSD